ncbi:MAG TPA: hypothetical protein VF820_06495 [Patescibacteria group bacterium]
MKKNKRKVARKVSRRSNQPKWFKRLLALFAVIVLVAGFGAVCIYFVHTSSSVLGAHIVATH